MTTITRTTELSWGLWAPMVTTWRAKGEFGGECARIACVNKPAHWVYEGDRRCYCWTCARAGNEASRRNGEPELFRPYAP